MTAPRLLGAAPHLTDPSGRAHVWFTDPPGIIDRFSEDVDITLVEWLIGPATDALRARHPDARWTFLHDWRDIKSYDIRSRPKLVAWGLALGRERLARIGIVIRRDAPAILRMACQAGVVPFALIGVPMEVRYDLDQEIARFGLRVAD